MNDQGVKFIENLMLARQGMFKCGSQFFIAGSRTRQAVAFEYAPGICVDYKNWMLTGVEKNGIGSFRADAAKSE
jgi:hypothetical protein